MTDRLDKDQTTRPSQRSPDDNQDERKIERQPSARQPRYDPPAGPGAASGDPTQ